MKPYHLLEKITFFSSALLACSSAIASQWETIDRDSLENFDPDCFYMAQLDANMISFQSRVEQPALFNQWTLATGVSPNTLEFSPMQGLIKNHQPRIFISSTSKGDDYLSMDGGQIQRGTFANDALKRYCPVSHPLPVDQSDKSYFIDDCIYRMQDWSEQSGAWYLYAQKSTDDIKFTPYLFAKNNSTYQVTVNYLQKNASIIQPVMERQYSIPTERFTMQCGFVWKTIKSDKFNSECLYRVKLDNQNNYQMAYSVSENGFSLFVSTFIPNGYTKGTTIEISTFDLSKYKVSRGGIHNVGIVNEIQSFCP